VPSKEEGSEKEEQEWGGETGTKESSANPAGRDRWDGRYRCGGRGERKMLGLLYQGPLRGRPNFWNDMVARGKPANLEKLKKWRP